MKARVRTLTTFPAGTGHLGPGVELDIEEGPWLDQAVKAGWVEVLKKGKRKGRNQADQRSTATVGDDAEQR